MQIPSEVPVMTLPHTTLFPQALLPLYIFEPRYRKMLADALETHRLFIVARQRPGSRREVPEAVAGLGMIRVSVNHEDGTSHLLLQGVSRVRLKEAVRYKPYRVQRIQPIRVAECDSVAGDALMAKVKELLDEWVQLGAPLPVGLPSGFLKSASNASESEAIDVLRYLGSLQDPESLADLAACTVLQDSGSRQVLLETENVEMRLRKLIHFLLAELRRRRKSKDHE